MSDSKDKIRRHRVILAVLRDQPIASQEELAGELGAHAVHATQSTLSRDLRELRVTRVPTSDGYRYVPPEAANGRAAPGPPERLQEVAALEVVSVEANEVVVAIKTIAGRAGGVAAYLDALALPDVVATLAGDDTVMVHPRNTRKIGRLRRRLSELFAAE